MSLILNSLEDLLDKAMEIDGWVYAITTNQLKFDYWDHETDGTERKWVEEHKERLLELRIFSETAEYRAFRGDIGQKLHFRMIKDTNDEFETDYFDEEQYLDVNAKMLTEEDTGENTDKDTNNGVNKEYIYKQSKGFWEVRTTTGGGPYTIPLKKLENAVITVRNYLDYYEDSGQAYVSDFRLVKLGNR